MHIRSAHFTGSSSTLSACPPPKKPEFAFIGRSNVGKSSLINMLTNRKKLAKTSKHPGKTQTINHFLINDQWYLVDLPGYGYARVSHSIQQSWKPMAEEYLLKRQTLYCTFVLIDSRHEPQPIDLDFINWLGHQKIPLSIVMTKIDKLSRSQYNHAQNRLQKTLYRYWETLPTLFFTSSDKKTGKEEIGHFIDKVIKG